MEQLTSAEPHRHTMERLETAKRLTAEGVEFWLARELGPILGYPTWGKFEPVIQRAAAALTANGQDPSHQIVQTGKSMGREDSRDYFLSRGASYLIAMNGEPSKAEIATAQIYFASKTRQMEVAEELTADQKRIEARDKVTKAFNVVSGVAQGAGVENKMQAVFHGARFQGLYEMSRAEVMATKGLRAGENLLDRAGALELSMHEFQMNLAADVIAKEGIRNQQRAIDKNKAVAKEVRRAVINSQGQGPEHIPLESEPIAVVRHRIKAETLALTKPKSPNA
jgi:DNA-damage-inducible protein D